MELNYRQYSAAGAPVLVLHGLFGSLSNWGWHCKQLAGSTLSMGSICAIMVTHPHSDQLDYQVMAEDVRQLIIRLGLKSCCIVGHSMGGKVAMQLALQLP